MTLTPLSEALRQARADLAKRQPDSEQDAALLAKLQRLQSAQALQPVPAMAQGPRLPRQVAWGGAWLAGGLLLLAGALLTIEPPGRAAAPMASPRADSGFLPVVSPAQWRQAMDGQAQAPVWLMPAELPRERLALLGLPYDATRANETVRAELMLHPSGQLLAVRFVQ